MAAFEELRVRDTLEKNVLRRQEFDQEMQFSLGALNNYPGNFAKITGKHLPRSKTLLTIGIHYRFTIFSYFFPLRKVTISV